MQQTPARIPVLTTAHTVPPIAMYAMPRAEAYRPAQNFDMRYLMAPMVGHEQDVIDAKCYICREFYSEGDMCVRLRCSYMFHLHCFDAWVVHSTDQTANEPQLDAARVAVRKFVSRRRISLMFLIKCHCNVSKRGYSFFIIHYSAGAGRRRPSTQEEYWQCWHSTICVFLEQSSRMVTTTLSNTLLSSAI